MLSGSPAVDRGSNAGCPATDQRGVARPQGARCDIGAYEAAPAPAGSRPPPPSPPPGGVFHPPGFSFLTMITSGPSGLTSAAPTFTFTSTIAHATFECRFDHAAYTACTTPFTTYTLANGAHTFYVRSVAPSGARDPNPASRTFTLGPTTRHGSCTIMMPWDPPSHSLECFLVPFACPAGARCTLALNATVVDADQRAAWTAIGVTDLLAPDGSQTGSHANDYGDCDSASDKALLLSVSASTSPALSMPAPRPRVRRTRM